MDRGRSRLPVCHTAGLRRLHGQTVDLTDEERATREALRTELDRLEGEYVEADELPQEVDHRLGEIETAIAAFEERPVVYDPAVLGAFYRMSSGTCLEISAKSASFSTQALGLADSASAKAIEARHQQWAKQLPKDEDYLWEALVAFDGDSQTALFAAARAVNLNMAAAGWRLSITISVAFRRRASSKRCGRRRARPPRSSSTI